MENAPQARHFPPGEGKTYKLGRMTVTFKTTAGDGWDAYTVCEAIEPPESGAGYHRHPSYDETFIIVEGHYDFRLDGKVLKLGPGDTVFVPRGTPHGFVSTGPETGRQIIISSPGWRVRCNDRRGHHARYRQPDAPGLGRSKGDRDEVRARVSADVTVRIVRLGSERNAEEGLRIGTVRRPPRGVPKSDFSSGNWYDVWFPNLAPSADAVKLALGAKSAKQWAAFVKRYRAEMAQPENGRILDLLAALSESANFSVGCYCEDESRCHRSILRELLLARGADVL